MSNIIIKKTTATTTVAAAAAAANAKSVARPPSSQPRKTTFIKYFESRRGETEAANHDATFNDIKRIIQKEFSKLSKEERAMYEDEIELDQAEVATIVSESKQVSESESDAESTVEDVGKPAFVFIELVHQGDNVSDEKVKAFLDLIRENSRVIVIGGGPLSNALAGASLYEGKADGIGYQERHERGTMQHATITKIINATNDDADAIDQVGVFLREQLDSVENALGTKVCDSFLNLNQGQKKTPNKSSRKMSWFGVAGSKSWHSDMIQVEKYSGRAFVHYLQRGKQGAVLLRPFRMEDLVVKVNIPHGCVVYMSEEILGFQSGNLQFPRCEHKHYNQGASMSGVLELKIDIETIESSTCSAIEATSRRQDAMHLDLEGRYGGDNWDPSRLTGSTSKDFSFKPREYTVLTDEEGRLVLLCSRIQRLTNGFVRNGVALFDIIGQQQGLSVQALEECMHTGGFLVGALRVFPLKYFARWGYTSGQLTALIEADTEAKELLVNLLTKNSNRTASQQVSITLFDNDDNVVGGPSQYSTRAGTQNKDKNEVTIPNLPSSMAHNGSTTITNKMIHAAMIDTKGVGLWIPKSTPGRYQGRWTLANSFHWRDYNPQ